MSPSRGTLGRILPSAVALAVWIVVATQIVPPLIVDGYHGRSWPVVNALLVSRVDHPVEEYLEYWRNITWLGAAWCVLIWLLAPLRRFITRPQFFDRAVGLATPGELGAIRFWVCSIMVVMAAWEDLASTVLLPRSMLRPKGVLHLLHALPIGFERFLENATAIWTFEHITIALLVAGAAGLATRIVLPLAAICYLIFIGILREYAWFYHTGLVPLYVLTVLCFTPCGDGWSLDRMIRIARGLPVADSRPQPIYGWSRYMVWTLIACVYVAAALSKLYYGGLAWFAADNMRATLLRTTLAPMEFDFRLSLHVVQAPDAVPVLLAGVGLFSELLMGLVLVSRRARLIMPAAIAATHVGILFLQNILFPDLILLPAVFYNFAGLPRAVARWLGAQPRQIRVFFDGQCGLCGRTVRILRGVDLLGRLDLIDFRRLPDDGPSSPDAQGVSRADLESEMAVVDAAGRVHWGFAAYRVLLWEVPIGWPLLLVAYLPGVRPIGEAVYRYVAARRAGICELLPDRTIAAPPPDAAHARGAAGALAIALLLMSWWVTHIEFFPLTTLKMFSTINPRVISYVRPVAFLSDGRREPARFEQWIGAMADSRYREVVLTPFREGDRQRCDDFLAAAVRAANRGGGEPRVVGIDLQFWQWDFAADPDNPTQGHLVSVYEYRPSRTW